MKLFKKLGARFSWRSNGIDFGDLRRFNPFCSNWGLSRGTAIGRYYVENFLRKYAPEMKGVFLEFGNAKYKSYFNPQKIERYEVVDLSPKSTHVTIIGDIQNLKSVVDDSFDCIVCTAVLEHVPDPFSAVKEIRRILRPGGWLLLTVPHINKIHRVPGDYWRFTEDSLRLLLDKFTKYDIEYHGNALTTLAFTYGLAAEDLSKEELDYVDKNYPVIFTCWAIK